MLASPDEAKENFDVIIIKPSKLSATIDPLQ